MNTDGAEFEAILKKKIEETDEPDLKILRSRYFSEATSDDRFETSKYRKV